MDVRFHESNKTSFVIRDLVYRCDCLGFREKPLFIDDNKMVHSSYGYTRQYTASDVNICQCRCDTSRDDT